MKLVRISTILAMGAACVSGMMLFQTSQNVQQAEYRLNRLTSQVSREQESIRVLRAEWDYLNRPDRLETLATQHLGMVRPDVKVLMNDVRQLPEPYVPVVPPRKPLPPRHVVYSGSGEQASAPSSINSQGSPSKPKITQEDQSASRKSFQDLIGTLSDQEISGGLE